MQNKTTSRKLNLVLIGAASVSILAGPLFINDYWQHIMIVCMYYIILAASWNLLAGYTGQFSLAHQTFAALGGYASGLMIYHLKVSIGVGFIAAVVVTAGTGFLLGLAGAQNARHLPGGGNLGFLRILPPVNCRPV